MIYTFYSYKGGVGRSMALANVAQWLYLQGLRVIVIDWDLEAPGIENFFYPPGEEIEEVRSQLGLIDMLAAYKRMFPKVRGALEEACGTRSGPDGRSSSGADATAATLSLRRESRDPRRDIARDLFDASPPPRTGADGRERRSGVVAVAGRLESGGAVLHLRPRGPGLRLGGVLSDLRGTNLLRVDATPTACSRPR